MSVTWTDVCAVGDLQPERAVPALVQGRQVAIVRLHDDTVHAVGQRDPYCDANVMSRGLVGSVTVEGREVPVIFSPMYKQAFDVRSGRAVAEPNVGLGSWAVQVIAGRVQVGPCVTEPAGVAPAEQAEVAAASSERARQTVEGGAV